MSQQKQFEGPDVRALLDQICTTYGTEPTIARAETFRTGGVLGFFQREHYRLVVDDPDAAATTEMATLRPADGPGPGGVPNGGRRPGPGGVPKGGRHFASRATVTLATAALSPAGRPPASKASQVGSGLAAYLEAANSEPFFAGARPAAAAGAVPDRAPLPAELRPAPAELRPAPAAPPRAPVATRPVSTAAAVATTAAPLSAASDLFGDLAESTVDANLVAPLIDRARALISAPEVVPAPAAMDEPGPTFESVLRRVATMVDAPSTEGEAEMIGAQLFSGGATFEPVPTTAEATATTATTEATATTGTTGATATTGTIATTGTTGTPAAAVERPGSDDDDDDDDPESAWDAAALRMDLVRCGLDPVAVKLVEAAAAAGRSIEGALLDLFAAQPRAPRLPSRPGSLVVVVGPGRRATEEAARIAGQVGSDPAGVALAAARGSVTTRRDELVIHNADEAAEMAPGHRRGRVGVVAVDAQAGAGSVTWARHVIDALRPTLLLAVVDALYKTEDLEDWIEGLGGVDGIIVDHLDRTASPARILDLELPVSRLGRQPATPMRWVATVLDRLDPESAEGPAAVGSAAPSDEVMDLMAYSPSGVEEMSGTWP